MNPPNADQQPPGNANGPVQIDRVTADAFADATRYVQRIVRGRDDRGYPRGTGLNPGIYALTTSTISAASGATLGSGTVTLCSRSGATLTADGETGVTVYNAGGSVASGRYVKLGCAGGAWSVDVDKC